MALTENNTCVLHFSRNRAFEPHLRNSLSTFRRLVLEVPVKEHEFSWSYKKGKLAVFLSKAVQHFIDGHKSAGSTIPLSLQINFQNSLRYSVWPLDIGVSFVGYKRADHFDNETFKTLYYKTQLHHFVDCMRVRLRNEVSNAAIRSNVELNLPGVIGRRVDAKEVSFKDTTKQLRGTVRVSGTDGMPRVSYILYDENEEI